MTRRISPNPVHILSALLALFLFTACQANNTAQSSDTQATGIPADQRNGKTEVIVMGLIHGGHRTSKDYPLSRIDAAVRVIDPDIILTEIPPDRIDAALTSYSETGAVTEQRTRAFPEYTDAIIPLQAELGYAIKGTAGWTPQIAATRRRILQSIENDPARADEWRQWQQAQATFRETLDGRGSDPLFIHTAEYDAAVETRYRPYIEYFGSDLGDTGWEAINAAHWRNIAAELDAISGQSKRVLITYGGFHKYQILRRLAERDDVIITNARPFFDTGG
ncbi:MAG: hypothetical protein AAGH53_10025 [Pseudomonadota bacterium]